MNLFTDDNPETTLHGLGFSTIKKTKDSIQLIETHFNKLAKLQTIPGYPKILKPHKFLNNINEVKRYYNNQKMTRVIALLNRAKSIKKKTKNKDKIYELEKSIILLENWVGRNKITSGRNKITLGRNKITLGRNKITLGRNKITLGGTKKNTPSCCHHHLNNTQCYREKDKKIFQLPRKFSKSKCSKIRGFSMRSSCAPYQGCS